MCLSRLNFSAYHSGSRGLKTTVVVAIMARVDVIGVLKLQSYRPRKPCNSLTMVLFKLPSGLA
jgi:hypothetical protein